jgi:hypothetical protein
MFVKRKLSFRNKILDLNPKNPRDEMHSELNGSHIGYPVVLFYLPNHPFTQRGVHISDR